MLWAYGRTGPNVGSNFFTQYYVQLTPAKRRQRRREDACIIVCSERKFGIESRVIVADASRRVFEGFAKEHKKVFLYGPGKYSTWEAISRRDDVSSRAACMKENG